MTVLCVFLALLFVMSVYTYGTNQRYSFMEHFENISEEFEQTPSLQELVTYWTSESFQVAYNGIVFYPHFGGGANSGGGFGGGSMGDDGLIYPEKVTGADWGSLEPLQEFVGAVKGFFVRAYYTILWFANFVIHTFFLVGVLLPWNGLVPREEVASVFNIGEVVS